MSLINKHQHLADHFSNLVANKQLAHGYIFYGPSLDSQISFTLSLANLLETNVFSESQQQLNDLLLLEGESSLGIDLIRELKEFLSRRPAISQRRMVVIPRAERLTSEAQNALLKITEEAPRHSLIILTTNHFNQLLPTLNSRLTSFFFSPLVVKSTPLNAIQRQASQFLSSSPAIQTNLIKKIVADEDASTLVFTFLSALIIELSADLVRNYRLLQIIFRTNSLCHEFQVNRRLQLEALAFELRSARRL